MKKSMQLLYNNNDEKELEEFEIIINNLHENKSMKRDLKLFLINALQDINDVNIITTCQKSKMDLLEWNEDAKIEKDRLLEKFLVFGNYIRDSLIDYEYWCDYCDAASGLLMNTDGNTVYPEVEALQKLCKYNTQQAGNCRVALHPKWGSSIYPATIFTNAPLAIINKVLNEFEKKQFELI